MARRKCSMSTAVFLTSDEYTSEPTIGQKGTLLPSSCATPSASAVLPLPGAPAHGNWARLNPMTCIYGMVRRLYAVSLRVECSYTGKARKEFCCAWACHACT